MKATTFTHIATRLMALAALLMASVHCHATVFTWSVHNLTFEVPDGGTVTYNSATHFEIMWQDMALVIDLYSKEGTNNDNMRNNLLRRASSFNMYDNQTNKIKVKGFKSYSLTGTMPDGSHTLLANLVCNNRDLLACVTINYLLGNIEEAEDIVKSFTIGKQKLKKEKKQKVQTEEDAIAKEAEEQRKKQLQKKKESQKNQEIFDI
ncbi:MAG: hypothetical protein ACI308_08830 [Muribaculaceae bacterium]